MLLLGTQRGVKGFMRKLRDLLPQPPWEGPPIPKVLARRKPKPNPHGGITQVAFKVKSLDKRREAALTGIADTGSIFTGLPPALMEGLGLPRLGETTFLLADGKSVSAKMYAGIIEVEGREVATTFSSLGEKYSTIGVSDLEKLGFKVNPSTGELEPTAILG